MYTVSFYRLHPPPAADLRNHVSVLTLTARKKERKVKDMNPHGKTGPRPLALASCAVLGALLALPALGAVRAEDAAAPAGSRQAVLLDEDAAARFIASLAPMRRLGRSIAQRAALIETNPDDPLMPYAHLSPEQLAGEAELGPLLVRHGFSGIAEWLAIGEPLMAAYYHVTAGAREEDWAQQLAGVLAGIRGLDEKGPSEHAAAIARLLADLRARRDAALPPEHIEIARKFRRSLELATDGTIK